MDAKTYTEVRAKLAEMITRVCNDHTPVVITRRRGDSAVLMSLEDYESLAETAYLLRSPRNARRLLDSIKEIEEGRGVEHALIEPE
ncbi:type II toxin-antitoxin system prevent-host-death family antitoxin [bacterium]|nr:type II toxin-antitoxin system prevent-host-death family antitoxin [bacterium]